MAKKKKGAGLSFNMSQEITALLKQDKNLSGREVLEALQKKFPNDKINANSCGVAYSNARKKLGIRKKTKVRRKKPAASAQPAVKARTIAASKSADSNIDALLAAKSLLQACGGDDVQAISAIKQLARLQIG